MDKNRKPDRISDFGTNVWCDENGEYHNDFGPAQIFANGSKFWYKHGKQHNENGPAIIYDDGNKRWYINGIEYTKQQFLQKKIKEFIDE